MPPVTLADAVDSHLAGYSSAATVAAYRCDLALWQRYCVAQDLDPLGSVVHASPLGDHRGAQRRRGAA